MIIQYLYLLSVVIIAVLFPIYVIFIGYTTKRKLLEGSTTRMRIYIETIIIQLVFCLLIFFSIYMNKDSIDIIGLTFFKCPLWVFVLIFACSLGILIINKIKVKYTDNAKLESSFKDVIYLMPSNDKEYKWAIITSLFVGLCEGIIFRGFL
ncbi:hypothetical protein [uncultured Psychroserpens sp.]|uniref:hypothetical protein n=1 Tax=uncultured Psychroserpens sp. TaxID=255436 RepID=UPI00262CA687|nr:hypothetical protein [uncultured Psychroserpens sp.]